MSDHERGAYTPPTDAPLAFDARRPVRGARPVPVTLIVSILVLAGLVVAIFVFYRSGVRQAGEGPQTVGAPIETMRAPAPAEAQPQDPAAGLEIYRAEDNPPGPVAPQFVPAPELPQARPVPPPAPVVIAAPQPLPPAVQPKAAPAVPAPRSVVAAPVQPATPAAKAVPAAAPPKKVESVPAPAPKSSGGAVVQVGAVSTPALADQTWSEAVAAAPGLAAGKGKGIERIERDGGVLYRTAVTGFASRDDALAFCARLKAAGKNCFVR